jgi:hypothetical protein
LNFCAHQRDFCGQKCDFSGHRSDFSGHKSGFRGPFLASLSRSAASLDTNGTFAAQILIALFEEPIFTFAPLLWHDRRDEKPFPE